MKLFCGKGEIDIVIPGENLCFNLGIKYSTKLNDLKREIKNILKHPVGTSPLSEMVKGKKNIVILADDYTRLTPTNIIIPAVLDELNKAGVSDSNVTIVIAAGSHNPMTESQIQTKFGEEVISRVKIHQHDYLDEKNLLCFGKTKRATNIWINKEVVEADFRIGIGTIFPHHPTGWSGGAKILLPGVAGKETIAQMHLLGATEQRLGEILTPCREEMEEFAKSTKLEFIINVVIDDKGNVVRIAAGDFIKAHREGIRMALDVCSVPFERKADITISDSYPVNNDLFQADKGLFSAEITTKEKGEILLISGFKEGIASSHKELIELANLKDDDIWNIVKNDPHNHDLLVCAEVLYLNHIKNKFKTYLVTNNLTENEVKNIGFNYLNPIYLQEYINNNIKKNPKIGIGVINQSTQVLPVFIDN
ncbi:nickel-dependent lactate racemase [bacterium]|nr:nickel-dependent lactate racemase [bacterium]